MPALRRRPRFSFHACRCAFRFCRHAFAAPCRLFCRRRSALSFDAMRALRQRAATLNSLRFFVCFRLLVYFFHATPAADV